MINEIFLMNGYGVYVWSSFLFTLLSFLSLYVVINIAMVMGLIPVVGVPLPLISYGGTAMMTLMFGFGLLLGVHVHRDLIIPRLDDS